LRLSLRYAHRLVLFVILIRRPPRSTLFPTRRSSDLGELHPKVVQRLGLPPRTSAAELDLDVLVRASDHRTQVSPLSTQPVAGSEDRKSTRLNSSHVKISYAVFCLKKKNKQKTEDNIT